ncbi:MAG TPA: enoyl-CoA hydratase/isomerase family protein [Dongiaceae bacterium]|nr:enoyl-CoA hydratase/isomerase family protein [Dongiaceae bacterium]
MTEYVQFTETDGVGTITFSNPEALNALGLEEINAIDSQLRRWRSAEGITGVILRGEGFRAFSSGENLVELYQALEAGDDAYPVTLQRSTHRLIQLWASYPKPTMAVMNGVATGLGAGLAMAASIRVVTDLTLFSIPHCRLGLVPDAGSAYYLAKCPGRIGLFLALTGIEIRAPGMLHAGLGTHYVPPEDVDWINFQNIDTLTAEVPHRPLAIIQAEIDRCFGQRTVGEIETVLTARPEKGFRDFLDQLRRGASLALALTYRHMTTATGRALEDILQESYRLNRRMMKTGNVKEAVRALLVDGGGKVVWPVTGVDGASVEQAFQPLSTEAELYFEKS